MDEFYLQDSRSLTGDHLQFWGRRRPRLRRLGRWSIRPATAGTASGQPPRIGAALTAMS